MARDGSGNYTRIHNWVTDLGNSIPITASRMDAEMDSEATALTNSLDRSAGGGGDILRNVGMSNNKLTSLGSGSALTDSINLDDVQSGKIIFFGTTAGSATVYTLAPSPSINALDTGMPFLFKVDQDCGASPTLNISAKGAKNMKKYNKVTGAKVDITTGDLQTSVFYKGVYDGTDVVILNPAKFEIVSIDKVFNVQKVTQTIASGVVAFTNSNVVLAAQTGTTDDFDGFSGGNPGDIVRIRPDTGDVITVKHSATFDLMVNLDVVLNDGNDLMDFECKTSGNWVEVGRSLSNSFRSASGYKYEPNNKLRQYGTYTSGAHAPTITFPIAFDATPESIDLVSSADIAIMMTQSTTSALSSTQMFPKQWKDDGTTSTVSFWWTALGTKAQ